MAKHSRHTVTITIIERWIIAWLPGDDPLCYPPTLGQDPANTEEPPDETLPTIRRRGKGARIRRAKGSLSKQ
jgi:hypothetical protein